jgi:hypothetical protein
MTTIPNRRLCVYTHSADGKVFYVGQATRSGHMNGAVEAEQIESEMIARFTTNQCRPVGRRRS